MSMRSFEQLLACLHADGVEFVVIGGLAATIHGSAHVTYDLDICYARTEANIRCLCHALAPLHVALRGAPADLPFRFDPPTVTAGLNFTLDTDLGPLDVFGEVPPFGQYAQVAEHAESMELFGNLVRVLTLDALIRAKSAAGRRKDLLVLPELEELLALRRQKP